MNDKELAQKEYLVSAGFDVENSLTDHALLNIYLDGESVVCSASQREVSILIAGLRLGEIGILKGMADRCIEGIQRRKTTPTM